MLVDSTQRSQATDPCFSFIVQAPAGSGKTEILTQRYLRLLSTVTAPEQIVALTFTRKAASEMRERILFALQKAAQQQQASSAHQQVTLDFAHQALARDAQFQWDLLQQPNRLRVITIDSLCQSITQAIPLLEQHNAYAQITNTVNSHYINAGRRCIQYALTNPPYQEAIKTLLLHVDNRHDRLLELFRDLLVQREQWLNVIFQARSQEKEHFEQALQIIEQHELNRFKESIPSHLAKELTRCVRQLALLEQDPNSPRYELRNWDDWSQITAMHASTLTKLLLTSDHHFRKSFDHHVGLTRSACDAKEYEELKQASKALLSELNEYPEFLDALTQVSHLPSPHYDLEQWDVLQSLFLVLPLLVGHLQVLLNEHNEVDFTTIAQHALTALGDAENPTDLALYLDNTLHHILVDEFQDTSITQFDLLTQLVQGWQEGDGKTLFIVGDPMQSIYRFRQAEVGLFYRAKEQGLGPVTLKALALRCNFRSTPTLVQWVNQQFPHIFPKQIDIESGAVSFHPSVHVIEPHESSGIYALRCSSREHEAQKLIQLIQEELKTQPQQSMAILVRSRTQLKEIIALLRQHQIPYQGTDITLLTHLSHLRDVWSFTEALLTPANRLSWLAALRSPYCGLSLPDLHAIARFNPKKSIYAALLDLNQIHYLSEEGRLRAGFFIQVMHQALTQRYEKQLSSWIIQTLKNLHMESILNESQLTDLEQFWALLDRYELDGRLPDRQEFLLELNKLYSQQTNSARLQVMTIHKSKGLEFDTVFLPGLGSQPNRGDKPMLRWLNVPTQKEGNVLLLSPIKGAHQEQCPLYDYLTQLDTLKNRYEAQRLLYVAVTRAKTRVYLMDHSEKASKSSFRHLLKHQEFLEEEPMSCVEEIKASLPKLQRLPLADYPTIKFNTQNQLNYSIPSLSSSTPRLIGVITHQILQWICSNHPQTSTEIPWDLALYQLKKTGLDEKMRYDALQTIQQQINQLIQDPIGSWIIAPHTKEYNELELLVDQHNGVSTRIIDRTFEDQGKCWIIDFKTGKENQSSLLQHQQQVNEYGFYWSNRTSLPIYCGLYYLASSHWVSWQISDTKPLTSR